MIFGICFTSSIFGVSLFVSEITNGECPVLGISWFGSVFGVLAAVLILLGANADDPSFFMQNHIIMVRYKS